MYLHCQADFGSGWVDVSPRNITAAKFELSWTNSTPSLSLQSIAFEFVNTGSCNDAKNVYAYRDAGLTGGPGIGEGIPFQVFIGYTTTNIFNGIIDIANKATSWEKDIVKAPLKKIGSIDWFMDQAEAIPMRVLYDYHIIGPPSGDPGYYPQSNPNAQYYPYKKVPYTITFRDWEQALMLFLEEFSMIQHTLQAIEKTIGSIGVLIGTATNVPFPTVPEVIADVVALILQIGYDVALVVALVSITEQLINVTVGVKKYKYAMKASDMINAGLFYMNNYLGSTNPNLTFSSTILNGTGYGGQFTNTTFMPAKNLKPPAAGNGSLFGSFGLSGVVLQGGALIVGDEAHAGTVGPPYGYMDCNLKELFTEHLMPHFNAEVLVLNNVVYFEERHFWDNQANFIIPNVVSGKGYSYNSPQPDGTNWEEELACDYMFKYPIDNSDEMTYKSYRGTTCDVNIQPIVIRNVYNLTPPPSRIVTSSCSLAKRKTTLNFAENVVNDILNAIAGVVNNLFVNPVNSALAGINAIITAFGGHSILLTPMPKNILFSRFGWLEISNDTFSNPKIFIGTPVGGDWYLTPDLNPNAVTAPVNANWNMNPAMGPAQTRIPQYYSVDGQAENAISAISIMNQFHGWNLSTRGNQWFKYTNKTFKLLTADFNTILTNNVFTTPTGEFGKFDKIIWDPTKEIAETVDYRINKNYNTNLIESVSADGATY